MYDLDDSNLEIDLKEIFFILRNRYKLIILTTLFLGTLALFYTYVTLPQYKSTLTIAIEEAGQNENIFNMGSDLSNITFG